MTLPGPASGRARLTVDPIACDGRGICAELLPGLITLDDWGFPIIHGDVPPALRDEAAEAARLCPKLALRLTAGRSVPGESVPGEAPARPAAGRRRRRWSRS
jgi:ferredoxin